MAVPFSNPEDITRTSIIVRWKSLTGTAAGGQNMSITGFEVQWKEEANLEKWTTK
jgi:hypothetical protein